MLKKKELLVYNIALNIFIDFILSHTAVNTVIQYKFNFNTQEIVQHYLVLLKGIALKLDNDNISLLFDVVS